MTIACRCSNTRWCRWLACWTQDRGCAAWRRDLGHRGSGCNYAGSRTDVGMARRCGCSANRRAHALAPRVSRYGIEASAASATITLAIASFFVWLHRRRGLWLLLTGIFFGLALYTYAISKALLPPLVGLLAILYWRDLKQSRIKALTALAIVFVLALPQAAMLTRYAPEMQAEFQHLSLFNPDTICPGCKSEQTKQALALSPTC